jgi:hypothetical protein
MAKRKALSTKLRFEVFKRDSFACQYCGAKAPDVVLHVDHVNPVKRGGKNDLLNLVTSCAPCNGGKGANPLDDKSVMVRQQDQLAQLQERREQIDMMLAWKEGLADIDLHAVNQLLALWHKRTVGWRMNATSVQDLRIWARKYKATAILDAMHQALDLHLELTNDGAVVRESVSAAWAAIPKICGYNNYDPKRPWARSALYARGILRKRGLLGGWNNEREALSLLNDAGRLGLSAEEMNDMAKDAYSWSSWHTEISRWVAEQYQEREAVSQ